MPINLAADVESLAGELEDRDAIRSLPVRYCDCIWRKDADSLAALFAEECSLELGAVGRPLTSPKEIRENLGAGLASPDSRARPFIHNQVFELRGDRAEGRCYLEVHLTQDGQTRTGVGYYEDEYVREKGSWKIRARRACFVTSPRG